MWFIRPDKIKLPSHTVIVNPHPVNAVYDRTSRPVLMTVEHVVPACRLVLTAELVVVVVQSCR